MWIITIGLYPPPPPGIGWISGGYFEVYIHWLVTIPHRVAMGMVAFFSLTSIDFASTMYVPHLKIYIFSAISQPLSIVCYVKYLVPARYACQNGFFFHVFYQ